jgi:exopolysaccharide biosynthesis WecB/TagA/CpsF family protein
MKPDSRTLLTLDSLDLTDFTRLASNFGTGQYGYVVTPNVDQVIRLDESADFQDCYAQAAVVLLDSRILAALLRLRQGLRLPVTPGSDAVSGLFATVIKPEDRIVLVGGTATQATALARIYGLSNLRHIDPPMGFIRDPQAVEGCLAAIEACAPFRFCLLAIGSPQQEIIARALGSRGTARGLALCIGASVNFLTGTEQRAPRWVQRMHAEWLFRLLQNPRRMAHRYLVRGPRILGALGRFSIKVREPVK